MDNTNGPNGTFPRDNGETINMVGVESRCLYFKQVGVIVCFILLFMDGGAPKADYRYVHKEVVSSDQSSNSQSSFVTKLNSLVSSARNIKTQNYFARNVTGIYHGHWALGGVEAAAENTKIDSMRKSTKAVTIQLRSVKLRSVADFDFIYGVARVYDAGISGSDLFYPLQGVFLAATGELHLLSSVEATEMLFLQLPQNLPTENVTAAHSTPEPFEREGSATAAEPTKFKDGKRDATLPRDESFESGGDETTERKSSRPRGLHSEPSSYSEAHRFSSEAFLEDKDPLGSLGDRRFFDDMGGLGGLLIQNSRHLLVSSTGSDSPLHVSGTAPTVQKSRPPSPAPVYQPHSLPVGNTGMILHLINLAQPASTSNNSSSPFTRAPPRWTLPDMNPDHMQAIGESALPVTFKNLQRTAAMERFEPGVLGLGLAFNAGVGGGGVAQKCRFSMKLQETPMEVSPGKDEQWTFFDQLVGNITNSDSMRVAGTKEKSAEKDKETEDVAAAASARSKAAYASTVTGMFESSDCGVYFNITATSFRMELAEVERKAINYSVLACGVCYFQFVVLFLQLAYYNTQAASTKTSILCMSLQSMLDAALCIGHLILCAALPQVFFAHFIWMAILKLLLFGVFEMRAVIIVYQARYAQEISSEGGMQGLRHRLFKFHLRFYAALFAAVVITSYCRKMPFIAILIFYSYWVPQIAWNTVCGTRCTIHAIYYIGTTVSRLFIPLYLLGCPNNFFSVLVPGAIPYSPATCVGLVLWSMLQLSMLIAQDVFGPRFFLPADMFPRGYDYFRPVPAHVLIGARTMPSGDGNSSSSTDLLYPPDVESGGLIECVICYNAIDTTNSPYMITPCDHLYHKACLEQWLSMKMECCICRSALPPLVE